MVYISEQNCQFEKFIKSNESLSRLAQAFTTSLHIQGNTLMHFNNNDTFIGVDLLSLCLIFDHLFVHTVRPSVLPLLLLVASMILIAIIIINILKTTHIIVKRVVHFI